MKHREINSLGEVVAFAVILFGESILELSSDWATLPKLVIIQQNMM